MYPSALRLFLVLFFLFYPASNHAQQPISKAGFSENRTYLSQKNLDFQPLTTHPEADFAGAVSPDGHWLVFTSSRSGNYDLWVKPSTGGTEIQLTRHKADDLNPAWSPDGRKIVFTSLREDATGDIWTLKIQTGSNSIAPDGKPKRLTKHQGLDNFAKYSPNGKYLAYVSDKSGAENIWVMHLKKKRSRQITMQGGTHPAWSGDGQWLAFTSFRKTNHPGSHLYLTRFQPIDTPRPPTEQLFQITTGEVWDGFPCWFPRGSQLVFSRTGLDANGDGLLTPADPVALWKVDLSETLPIEQTLTDSTWQQLSARLPNSPAFQLTPWGRNQTLPYWSRNDQIYFTGQFKDKPDIFLVPGNGVIEKAKYATAQLDLANRFFQLPAPGEINIDRSENFLSQTDSLQQNDALFRRLLALQRVIDYFPENKFAAAWAYYEIGRTFKALALPNLSTHFFNKVVTEFSINVEAAAFAEIERIESRAAEFGRSFQEEKAEHLETILDFYKQILQKYQNYHKPAARIKIIIADLLAEAGEKIQALPQYEQIIQQYPHLTAQCAESQFKKGFLLTRFGEAETARQAFVKGIVQYPNEKKWVNRAVANIFSFEKNMDDSAEKIRAYHDIATNWPQVSILAATAQYKIALTLFEDEDYENTHDELEQILNDYPNETELVAQARLLQAKIYLRQGEDLRGFENYEAIIRDYANSLQVHYADEAEQRLIEMLLESGERLWSLGELPLAYARFKKASIIQLDNIVAHRGVIKCMYQQRKIDRAIADYQATLAKEPENEILKYSLGLCYSYKAERRDRTGFDVAYLEKSNQIIEEALSQNYQLLQAYLTLSVNYELMERHETSQRQQPRRWYQKIAGSLTAPLLTFYRFVFRIKEQKPERWFEKAIDVLTTAIALNNEKEDSRTEALLSLNLANNYYQLGEYGYEKAYLNYIKKLKLDSTFQSKEIKAYIFTRIGHCALVTEDFEHGPDYLKHAIRLNKDLGKTAQMVGNIKRLALLYQLSGKWEKSIDYFSLAAQIQKNRSDLKQKVKSAELATLYRQIAYNYNFLEDEEEIEKFTQSALSHLKSDSIKAVKPKANWLKIGFFGWEFPIYNAGKLVTGQSTAYAGFTTGEEIALLYSISENSAVRQQKFQQAIEFHHKKLKIYQQLEHRRAQAIIYNNIAYLYYLQGDFLETWKYLKASLEICHEDEFYNGALTNILNLTALTLEAHPPDQFIKPEFAGRRNLVRSMNFGSIDAAIEYVDQGLRYYENDEILLNPKYKIMLLNIIGNLHLIKAFRLQQKPDDRRPFSKRPQDWLDFLNEMALADSSYRTSLRVAPAEEFPVEISLAYLNRGLTFYAIGEPKRAFDQIIHSRQLARQFNITRLLWRIDHLLGNLLWQLSPQNRDTLNIKGNPELYFNNALNYVQENILVNQLGSIPQFQNKMIRRLYEDAIACFFHSKDIEKALHLAESMRAHLFLGTITGKRPTLKSEYDKNFWGNAYATQELIHKLNNQLQQLKFSTRSADSSKLIDRRDEQYRRYHQLLLEIRSKEPELEAFVRVNPPAYQTVQRIIPENSAIVNYITTPAQLFIWVITQDNFTYRQIDIDRQTLRKISARLIRLVQTNSAPDSLFEVCSTMNHYLLDPIWDFLQDKTEIIFVPDEGLDLVPFGLALFHANNQQIRQTPVVVPSLAAFYHCYRKRKLSGGTVLFGTDDNTLIQQTDSLGYQTERLFDGVSEATDYPKKLAQANVIHLTTNSQWKNIDPVLSQFSCAGESSQPFTFTGMNILSWNLKSNLIIFDNQNPVLPFQNDAVSAAYLQQALFYTGAPSLLIPLWQLPAEQKREFYAHFYNYLSTEKPGAALTHAQQAMHEKYGEPAQWAGFQLHGFSGMSPEQELIFAEQSFSRRVKMGNSAFNDGVWEEAIGYYEDAIQMARTRNDSESVVKLYGLITEVAFQGKIFNKAIDYQSRLLEIARNQNDVAGIAEAYFNLMIFHTENRQFSQAVIYQQKYAKLAQEYGLNAEEAESYLELGRIYRKSGETKKSIEAYRKALDIFTALEDQLKIGETKLAIGRIHLFHSRNYTEAQKSQSAALRIFQAEGDDQNQLLALRELGLTQEYMANFQAALKSQETAFQLASEIEDTLSAAICQYNLANIAWKTGDYQIALKKLRQANAVFNRYAVKQLNAVALSTEGLILMTLGQLDKALETELKAKQLAKSINSRRDLSAINKNIGLIYKQKNQWQPALDHFYQALQIDSLLNDSKGLADAYRNIGSINLQTGQTELAQQQLQISLRHARRIKDGRNETHCYYALGQTLLAQNQPDSALFYFEQAIRQAEYFMLPEISWRANRLAGKIWWERRDLTNSLKYLQQAESVIEAMRARIKIEDYKAGFIDDKLEVYSDLVEMLLDLEQPEKALEMAERAKSRNFVEMLANKNPAKTQGRNGELAARQDSLEQSITATQSAITILRLKSTEITVPEKEQLVQLEQRLGDLKNKHQQNRIQLQETNPELADLVSVNPKKVPEIMSLLTDSVALVEFFYSKDKIFCWILDRQQLQSEVATFPVDSLGRLIINFRDQITNRLTIDRISKQIYDILIQPIENKIAGYKHLVIVPHGFLHYLPFAALMNENDEYLLDKYSISLAPSATVLAYCKEKGDPFINSPGWQPEILALGNPDLGDPSMNLDFAMHEIRSISRTFPGMVKAYRGDQATETNFKLQSKKASMIVFSCHGEYDLKNPLFSALLLTPDETNNGRLEAHEIFDLKLNCYLLVMSACETGLGTLTGGDEVIGLSRSFIFAGASSLMASLWKVDDLATAVLIKRFFRYLKTDKNRSVALRKAQLLVRREINAHPAFWAAFHVIGDYR